MTIEVLYAKIHQVKVTEANLNYVGSISIDKDLLDASTIIVGQKVYVLDVNNGERIETYVIEGKQGSGEICVNGPAARKIHIGDTVIIIAYASMTPEEAKAFTPNVIFPNKDNKLSKN